MRPRLPAPWTWLWTCLLIAGGLGGSGDARAEGPASGAAAAEKLPGYAYYQQYCSSCHGVHADGKGRVASLLKREPTDLRRLTGAFGSPLPEAKVAEFIEGQRMVVAHGRADMPVWGRKLKQEVPPGLANQPARRMIIDQIVDYLAAIQVEVPATATKPEPEHRP